MADRKDQCVAYAFETELTGIEAVVQYSTLRLSIKKRGVLSWPKHSQMSVLIQYTFLETPLRQHKIFSPTIS